MSALTIGQFARQAGVTVETLRLYEKRGLLPLPVRTATGYRKYDAAMVRRVHFIQRAKQLGFSLKEITELLNLRRTRQTSCAQVQQYALAKVADIEHKLRELQRMRSALQTLAARCDGFSEVSACPILDALDESTQAASE